MNRRKWALVLCLWVAIVAAFAVAAVVFQKRWTPPGHPPNLGDRVDQCEAIHVAPGTTAGTILEPQNTWSNAAYLLAGLVILFSSRRPLGRMMGLQFCMLAIFSGLYHGTLQDESSGTFDARTLDVSGIYFVLWAEICYAVQCIFPRTRLRGRAGSAAEWGVGIAFTGLSYVMARNRFELCAFSSLTAVFELVAVLLLLFVWQMSRLDFSRSGRIARWYCAVLLFSTAVAVGCKFSDGHQRILCLPDAPIQPHLIWHIFTAVTLLCTCDFFAWSSNWDHAAFNRSGAVLIQSAPEKITAGTAILFGVTFLSLTRFAPRVFLDMRHADHSGCLPAGYAIGAVFLTLGMVLAGWSRRVYLRSRRAS